MRIQASILTLLLASCLPCAHAQNAASGPVVQENPADSLAEDAERGWFWYERDPEPKESEATVDPVPPPSEPPPATEKDPCQKRETWTVECGFVNPGKDFEFQAKQRDALLKAMAMSQNDPETVEQFQYYMKWLMERSIEVANLWYYNMVQNPELDANVKSPISSFGLRLMTQVKDASDDNILAALRDAGAFLVYFSRHNCDFCHAMTSVLNDLEDSTGLEIWNAPLDDQCMPGFEDKCKPGQETVMAAQALRVSIVPTLFLYVPGFDAADDTWIRIATGVTDHQTMRGRIVSFFTAYRTALLKGVANGDGTRAPVDFSDTTPTGTAPGVPLPTEEQIKELLAQ